MDEFALWVRLQDVDWATASGARVVCDAVVRHAIRLRSPVLVGTRGRPPFGLDDPASISGTAVAVALILGLAVICSSRGPYALGVIGLDRSRPSR